MLNMHSYSIQNANFADIFQFRMFGDCLISTGTAVIMMLVAAPRGIMLHFNICKYKYLTAGADATM
jgi:hypothetical protein